MKKLLILPRDRYKSPTSKYRTSRHIKGTTRLAPMNQNRTDTLNNNISTSNLNKFDTKVSIHNESTHSSSFDSSLQEIPPLIIPSKEESAEPTGKRLEFHNITVHNICACEVEGILNYAIECLSQMEITNISSDEIFQDGNESSTVENIFNQNKLKFLKGEFSPKSIDSYHPLKGERQTILSTFHTIDSQSYLNFTSELVYKSLSNIFNVEISEKHICDPNPVLNSIINEYQNQMIPFLSPYFPYKQIPFPFIIGVGGPPSSGKTTVCQFLQKAFTVNIIHIIYISSETKKSDTKPPTSLKKQQMDPGPDSMMITELIINNPENDSDDSISEEEDSDETEKPPPYYPLPNAYEINYSDDKSTVNSIVTLIQNIMNDNNNDSNKNDFGFVIDGFPNNKNQNTLLEKALASKNVNMHEKQIKHMLVPPLQRARAQMTNIDGIIITTASPNNTNNSKNNEKSANTTIESGFIPPKRRLVDPDTGNIYSPNFHMPGLADLIGICPPFFAEKKDEIEKRLVEVPLDETTTIKSIQKFTQFESTLRKVHKSLLIENCSNSIELLELLDEFIQKLYKNVQGLIPTYNNKSSKKSNQLDYNKEAQRIKPMITLMHPSTLIKPELTFTAMSAWSQCIEVFGKPISDQSQLVTSLSEKVETIQKVAIERYQLLISQRDDRDEVCSNFIEEIKRKLNVNNFFGLEKSNRPIGIGKTSEISVSSPNNKAAKSKANPRFKTSKVLKEASNQSGHLIDMKELNDFISNHFRLIWDLSIQVRTKNLEFIDDLVNKCGLIELILEFRKSPKKYFIFLVNRMIYVKWFFDTFSYIHNHQLTDNTQLPTSPFFEDFQLRTIEIPQFDFQSSSPPTDIKTHQSMFNIDANEIKKYNRKPPNGPENISEENPKNKITNMKSYAPKEPPINRHSMAKHPESSRPIFNLDDGEITVNQPESSRLPEKRCLAKVCGIKCLEENMKLNANINNDDEGIYFDSTSACNSLGVMKFKPSKGASFEKETIQYAEEFFNHVFVSFDEKSDENAKEFDVNSLIANEAKICLNFFQKFATACRRKEASMVNSVFDLQESLTTYANSKTTREMEKFSQRFRTLRAFITGMAARINSHYESVYKKEREHDLNDGMDDQNAYKSRSKRFAYLSPFDIKKQREKMANLNSNNYASSSGLAVDNNGLFNSDEISYFLNLSSSELFEYDIDLISEDVQFLAELSLSLDPPLVMQGLLPFDSVADVAEEVSGRGQIFTNISDFLNNARNAKIGDFNLMKLELCARVAECVESFDAKPFLLLFARSQDEEDELIDILSKPPKPSSSSISSSLSSFVKGMAATAALLSAALTSTMTTTTDDGEEDENDVEEEEEEAEDFVKNNNNES